MQIVYLFKPEINIYVQFDGTGFFLFVYLLTLQVKIVRNLRKMKINEMMFNSEN